MHVEHSQIHTLQKQKYTRTIIIITGQQSAVRASACQERATLTVNLKMSYKDFCCFSLFQFQFLFQFFLSVFCILQRTTRKCCCFCCLCIVVVVVVGLFDVSMSCIVNITTTNNYNSNNVDNDSENCVSVQN